MHRAGGKRRIPVRVSGTSGGELYLEPVKINRHRRRGEALAGCPQLGEFDPATGQLSNCKGSAAVVLHLTRMEPQDSRRTIGRSPPVDLTHAAAHSAGDVFTATAGLA